MSDGFLLGATLGSVSGGIIGTIALIVMGKPLLLITICAVLTIAIPTGLYAIHEKSLR